MKKHILLFGGMKRCKILFLLLFSALFWNCAESDMEFENEVQFIMPLDLDSEAVNVDKLLAEDTPVNLRMASIIISNNSYGNKVLYHVKKLLSNRKIYFELMLDEYGVPERKVRMGYAGGGKIYYTELVLRYVYIDELLFHEFFHICQNGLASPRKSLTNEVEAYIAQYLYAQSKGDDSFAIPGNGKITREIIYLASCIDTKTGQLKEGVDSDEFYRKYNIALSRLSEDPHYADYVWDYQNRVFPFPNLSKLFSKR